MKNIKTTATTENGRKVLTMAEYIEREATIELLRSLGSRDYRREKGTIQEAIKMVSFPEYTPSADVAPVRHGRWLDRPKNQGLKDEEIGTVGMVGGEPWSSCYCSECGEWLVASDEYAVKGNYCPNCGAKMDDERRN